MSSETPLALLSASNSNQINNNNTISDNNNHNIRDVQRAGWLRYLPFAERSNASSDEYKFWVVFSIVSESEPYLEFYQKRQLTAGTGNSGPVSKHSLKRCRHISPAIVVNEKCFNEFAITLDTHVIRLAADSQLLMQEWVECLKIKLRQLNVLHPKDNLYTNGPQMSARQAWRPLPPIPVANSSSGPVATTSTASEQRASSPTELYEAIFDERTVQRSQSLEPLSSNIPMEEGPPPYEAISLNTSNPLSLRESQVLRLRKEIAHPSGVRLMIRKKDSHNSIALVDLYDSVWIAGWKQKDFPVLHNTFHIGDQLLSINGEPVSTAQQSYRLIKQNDSPILEIIVKRVPNGKVFCIKRRTEGQDLGIEREGNTAQIKRVISGGLADKAGLTQSCSYANQQCNWCLTEVNNRALNLFFKANEIQDRLNAVGKEISILVQPLDFIKKLKKQLKQMKNHKDYIVQ